MGYLSPLTRTTSEICVPRVIYIRVPSAVDRLALIRR
jgi:hypothetical protein